MVIPEEKLAKSDLPCVRIGLADAERLKAKAVAMKRAALGIKHNAKLLEDEADALIKLFDDLKIELSEP